MSLLDKTKTSKTLYFNQKNLYEWALHLKNKFQEPNKFRKYENVIKKFIKNEQNDNNEVMGKEANLLGA